MYPWRGNGMRLTPRKNYLSGLKVRDEGSAHLLKVIWVVSKLGLTTS